jgi:peroxiredoxin
VFWRTVVRASGDPRFLADGRWGQMVAMMDATFRMLSTGASWSGHERNHLFLGRPGEGKFVRVSGISGLDDGGDSMSAAMLDFDRDGWMDVALGNISKPRFRLLRNAVKDRQNSANGFVALRFVGGNDLPEPAPGWSARDALGARVEVDLGNGRRIVREYSRNDGFKAQHTGTLLIGIGTVARVQSLRVVWPSGREQTVANVDAGTLVTIYENAQQSPTGEAAVREAYARNVAADTTPTTLRIEGVHGEQGLTVYTTMSTFCAVCMKSIPDMRALRNAFGDDELTLVGIPVASVDTDQKLRDYVKIMKPAYAIQIGLPQEVTQRVRDLVTARLQANGESTPASFVTDSTGRILAVQWGIPTLSELKQLQANERE